MRTHEPAHDSVHIDRRCITAQWIATRASKLDPRSLRGAGHEGCKLQLAIRRANKKMDKGKTLLANKKSVGRTHLLAREDGIGPVGLDHLLAHMDALARQPFVRLQ